MGCQIETYEEDTLIDRLWVEGTEDAVVQQAKNLPTPTNVDFVRVIRFADGNVGIEIWSERRDA